MKDMDNIINYSIGFLDGVKLGKREMLSNIGRGTVESMKQFIDSMARVDNDMLHHVYEWNQVGSPSARLFDIQYTVSNLGLSIKSTFSQSTTVQSGSKIPFYDKARIMENGIPVTIRPVRAEVLSFNDDGEQVFTKKPVTVMNPGGQSTTNGFEQAFDNFMNQYFTQSFLNSSGIIEYLQNPVAYKNNLASGKRLGKTKGYSTGYRWIANTGALL
jgi:hypothetical protein